MLFVIDNLWDDDKTTIPQLSKPYEFSKNKGREQTEFRKITRTNYYI